MSKLSVVVTGSCGLIGSEACLRFHRAGYAVIGIDNNQRAAFFGPAADTSRMRDHLRRAVPGYEHHEFDIRDRQKVLAFFQEKRPAAIVHTAAQPSHDYAAQAPFDDFDINALGTLNVLEAARQWAPEAPFVHLSTNKVYGDRPNAIALVEEETRWDYADPAYRNGIPETLSIDQCVHSLMGVSKAAADLLVQEYGRYFGMPTCALRAGCLTGPHQAGVELHGFLNYLVYCNLAGREYKVFGYKGKQVRDNLHASDVASFALRFVEKPRCGEVYNLGGGVENSCSILEAFAIAEEFSGRKQAWSYVERNRVGDHICYYSDLTKIKSHFPAWSVTRSLKQIISDIAEAFLDRRQLKNGQPAGSFHST